MVNAFPCLPPPAIVTARQMPEGMELESQRNVLELLRDSVDEAWKQKQNKQKQQWPATGELLSGFTELTLPIIYCHEAMGARWEVVHIRSAPAFSYRTHEVTPGEICSTKWRCSGTWLVVLETHNHRQLGGTEIPTFSCSTHLNLQ